MKERFIENGIEYIKIGDYYIENIYSNYYNIFTFNAYCRLVWYEF